MQQYIRYSIMFLLTLLILTTVPAMTVAAEQEGTVTASILNVRASASTTSGIVNKLQKGDKVIIKGSTQDWYKITAQSKEGFVHKQYIQIAEKMNTSSKSYQTTIIVNGEKLELEFEPPMENNRILVPFAAIGKALGINFSWSQAEKKVFASDKSQNKHVVFTIDDVNTIVNNKIIKLEVPPRLLQNRTLLPLRFFAEEFGAVVKWDQATKTATINRVVEEVKSVTPTLVDGLTAKVTASSLNVRSSSNTSSSIVSKLLKDQSATVIDFEAEWLKIQHGGIIGYVHSGYVELTDVYGQKVKGLVNPSLEVIGDRQIATWSKIAGPNITTKFVENTLTITSDAKLIERMDVKNEAIKEIRYQGNDNGTQLSFVLNEGYTAIVSDTLGKVTISIMKKTAKAKLIVIDAGHGGKYPGAVANGLQEKEINLDVSLRLRKLLENAGIEVIMTRADDRFLELAERVEVANKYNANAFISIHANGAANESVNGTETFWNATYSSVESKQLAENIQKQLLAKLGTRDRGVKEANFHVIRNAKMPSVLVELGFMTNKTEAARLATNDFRQKSAEAIFQGIMEFYK